MVPSLGRRLSEEPVLFGEVWDWGTTALGLGAPDEPQVQAAVAAVAG
jgi:hypothetical protein